MTRPWRFSIALLVAASLWAQAPAVAPGTLTLEEVIRMVETDLSEDVIVTRLKQNSKAFNLNPEEINALRKFGVSQTVIRYMVDPALPYPPAGGSAPAATAAKAAAPARVTDPQVTKLPTQNGVHILAPDGQLIPLELKQVVVNKRPGALSKISGGLVKGSVIGSLIGATSKAKTKPGAITVYMRLADKVKGEDLAVLTLVKESDRRDLDFGNKADKPTFAVSTVHPFEASEVGEGVLRLKFDIAKPGEYVIFMLGSGDPKKSLLGTGYEFGVS